jgi:hypothetical protein
MEYASYLKIIGWCFRAIRSLFPVKVRFECFDSKNMPDLFCGLYGTGNDNQTSKLSFPCICNHAFGGFHCEFDPVGPYVMAQAKQFINQYDGKSTGNYEPNGYHDQFWANYTHEELNQILRKAYSANYPKRKLQSDHGSIEDYTFFNLYSQDYF